MHKIKISKNRKKKLKNIYIQRVIKWVKNLPIISMNCRKIAKRSITYKTVNNNLKKHYGIPKNILKYFIYKKR